VRDVNDDGVGRPVSPERLEIAEACARLEAALDIRIAS
jgi:hypothetical protein